MARDYLFTFGSGAPSARASLSPTFISFVSSAGATLAAPAITETYAGTGFYKVNYNATQTVFGVMDGATTGLGASERYIPCVFDPFDMMGQTLSAMSVTLTAIGVTTLNNAALINALGITLVGTGVTLVGIGNTVSGIGVTTGGFAALLGNTTSSFGSTSVDPTTVFGFLKRAQEYNEGNRSYAKSTGLLDYFSRGSSTLLIEKTVSDSTTGTTCI